MPNKLTIINVKGATIRTGPSTSGGEIYKVPLGTVLDFVNVLTSPSGDKWALLGLNDPKTGKPWRYNNAAIFAFVAVYVSGVPYADAPEVPPAQDGERNALIDEVLAVIAALKR